MPDKPEPRNVAGLWCTDVLEHLPDYVEDDLGIEERAAVEAHLLGCGWCARFGGAYAGLVQRLRERLSSAPSTPTDVADRLAERLEAEVGGD